MHRLSEDNSSTSGRRELWHGRIVGPDCITRNTNIDGERVLVFIRHEFCNEVFWNAEKLHFFNKLNEFLASLVGS